MSKVPATTKQAPPRAFEDARRAVESGRLGTARVILRRFLSNSPNLPAQVRRQAEQMLHDVERRLAQPTGVDREFRMAETLYHTGQYGKAEPMLRQLKAQGESLPDPMARRVDDYLEAIAARKARQAQEQAQAAKRRAEMLAAAEGHVKAGNAYEARNLLVRLDAQQDDLSEDERKTVAKYLEQTDAQIAEDAASAEPSPAAVDATRLADASELTIDVTNPQQAICTVNASVLYLTGSVRGPHPIADVTVTHNGGEVKTRGFGAVTAKDDPKCRVLSSKITLAEGKNVIEIAATDGKAQASKVLTVTFLPGQKALYGDSWAVVIGINRYQTEPWDGMDLNYAAKDAMDFAKLLHERFGFDRERIALLLDHGLAREHAKARFAGDVKRATRENIVNSLTRLDSKRVKEEDRVIFFFAGHGHTLSLATGGEMGFLVPEDGGGDSLGDYYSTAIPMQQLGELCQIIPAKHVLFLVDACYSGLCTTERRGLPTTTSRYIEKMAKLQVRQIITAGLKDEQVIESSKWGNSAFTTKLKEALTTGAADVDSDGYITGSELGKYLKPAVTNLTDGAQTPKQACFFGDGEFLFEVK